MSAREGPVIIPEDTRATMDKGQSSMTPGAAGEDGGGGVLMFPLQSHQGQSGNQLDLGSPWLACAADNNAWLKLRYFRARVQS